MTETTTDTPDYAIILSLVGAIADKHFPSGDRASLRRMDPDAPLPLAYWRLAADRVPEERRRGDMDRRWALVCQIAALLRDAHQKDRKVGAVFREMRYSEMHLGRLLASEGATWCHLLLRAARWLSSRGTRVDMVELGRLALSDGRDERLKAAVARAYF